MREREEFRREALNMHFTITKESKSLQGVEQAQQIKRLEEENKKLQEEKQAQEPEEGEVEVPARGKGSRRTSTMSKASNSTSRSSKRNSNYAKRTKSSKIPPVYSDDESIDVVRVCLSKRSE